MLSWIMPKRIKSKIHFQHQSNNDIKENRNQRSRSRGTSASTISMKTISSFRRPSISFFSWRSKAIDRTNSILVIADPQQIARKNVENLESKKANTFQHQSQPSKGDASDQHGHLYNETQVEEEGANDEEKEKRNGNGQEHEINFGRNEEEAEENEEEEEENDDDDVEIIDETNEFFYTDSSLKDR